MPVAALRVVFISCVAWLIPVVIVAAPITDFDSVELDDVLIVPGQQTLSWEDVQTLLARNDHGWHLGWFKNRLGGDVYVGVFDETVGVSGALSLIATPIVMGSASGSSVTSSSPLPPLLLLATTQWGDDPAAIQQAFADPTGTTGASASIAAPEPASLVFFATGLMFVGRHFRSKHVRPRD